MKPRMRKLCEICGKEFIPDKYHPYQKVCSSPECQHRRQLKNQRDWRKKNPHYFKYKEKKTEWERKRAQYLKIWRETHKDYFKQYRKNSKFNFSK